LEYIIVNSEIKINQQQDTLKTKIFGNKPHIFILHQFHLSKTDFHRYFDLLSLISGNQWKHMINGWRPQFITLPPNINRFILWLMPRPTYVNPSN